MTAVTLPQLSLSMEEGKVLRWLVGEGEEVAEGQPIVEIETDKATVEVEAPSAGVIRNLAPEGAVLAIESPLAEIVDGVGAPAPTEQPSPEPAAAAPAPAPPARDGRREAVSPAARRIAADRGIDLAAISGSGPGGRIMARDLEQAPAAAPTPSARATGLREAVVANITASWQQIPHVHIGGELAADGLAEARRRAALPSGERVTITDLLILAVVRALRDVPELNGARGARAERIDLALAVATAEGVVAPVLRDAAERSLAQVARERSRLVAAAREGTLDPRDLAGGTFTLSNLGAYPVDFFAPVVSGPQIAMLATGRVVEKPVAVDGMLAVRHRLWANIAIDHRSADGETGGRFLAALERRLAELPATI
jgi:pyruvate dehydrogenase E2 component (dihydrolipoamide acetyltransferase)